MDLNTILTGMSNFFQKSLGFLFGSKWTIWIILLIVVIYFILKGRDQQKRDTRNTNIVEKEVKK